MSRLTSMKEVGQLLHLFLVVQTHVAGSVRVGLDANGVEGAEFTEGELVGLASRGSGDDLSQRVQV